MAEVAGQLVSAEDAEVRYCTLDREIRNTEGELRVFAFKLKSAVIRSEELEEEVEELRQTKDGLRTSVKEYARSAADLEKREARATKELAALGQRFDSLTLEHEELTQEHGELTRERDELAGRLATASNQDHAAAAEAAEAATQRAEEAENAKAALLEQLEAKHVELTDLQAQLERVVEKGAADANALASAVQKHKDLDHELSSRAAQLAILTDSLAAAKQDAVEKHAENNALHSSLAALEASAEEQQLSLLQAAADERADFEQQLEDAAAKLKNEKSRARAQLTASLFRAAMPKKVASAAIASAPSAAPSSEEPSPEQLLAAEITELKLQKADLEEARDDALVEVESLRKLNARTKERVLRLEEEASSHRERARTLEAEASRNEKRLSDMKAAMASMAETLESNSYTAQSAMNELAANSKSQARHAAEQARSQSEALAQEYKRRAQAAEENLENVQRVAEERVMRLQEQQKKLLIKLQQETPSDTKQPPALPTLELTTYNMPSDYARLRGELRRVEEAALGLVEPNQAQDVLALLQAAGCNLDSAPSNAELVVSDANRLSEVADVLEGLSHSLRTAPKSTRSTPPHSAHAPAPASSTSRKPSRTPSAVPSNAPSRPGGPVQASQLQQTRPNSPSLADSPPATAAKAVEQTSISTSNASASVVGLPPGKASVLPGKLSASATGLNVALVNAEGRPGSPIAHPDSLNLPLLADQLGSSLSVLPAVGVQKDKQPRRPPTAVVTDAYSNSRGAIFHPPQRSPPVKQDSRARGRARGFLTPLERSQSVPALPEADKVAQQRQGDHPTEPGEIPRSQSAAQEIGSPPSRQQKLHKLRDAWLAHGTRADEDIIVRVNNTVTCAQLPPSRPISQMPQSRAAHRGKLAPTASARSFWAQELPAMGMDPSMVGMRVQTLAVESQAKAIFALQSHDSAALDALAASLAELQALISLESHPIICAAIEQVGLQADVSGAMLAAPSVLDIVELLTVLSSQATYGVALHETPGVLRMDNGDDQIRSNFRREVAHLRQTLQVREASTPELPITPRFSNMAQAIIRREELLQRKKEVLKAHRLRNEKDLKRIRKQIKAQRGPGGAVMATLRRMEQECLEASQRWDYKKECLAQDRRQLAELAMKAFCKIVYVDHGAVHQTLMHGVAPGGDSLAPQGEEVDVASRPLEIGTKLAAPRAAQA